MRAGGQAGGRVVGRAGGRRPGDGQYQGAYVTTALCHQRLESGSQKVSLFSAGSTRQGPRADGASFRRGPSAGRTDLPVGRTWRRDEQLAGRTAADVDGGPGCAREGEREGETARKAESSDE